MVPADLRQRKQQGAWCAAERHGGLRHKRQQSVRCRAEEGRYGRHCERAEQNRHAQTRAVLPLDGGQGAGRQRERIVDCVCVKTVKHTDSRTRRTG